MATVPTVDEVRAWSGVNAASVTDDQLTQIVAAETALQAACCGWIDPYPDALAQAILRRCSRELGARQLPLGLSSETGEYAPVRMPSWDVEIERLEAPYRIVAVA